MNKAWKNLAIFVFSEAEYPTVMIEPSVPVHVLSRLNAPKRLLNLHDFGLVRKVLQKHICMCELTTSRKR